MSLHNEWMYIFYLCERGFVERTKRKYSQKRKNWKQIRNSRFVDGGGKKIQIAFLRQIATADAHRYRKWRVCNFFSACNFLSLSLLNRSKIIFAYRIELIFHMHMWLTVWKWSESVLCGASISSSFIFFVMIMHLSC